MMRRQTKSKVGNENKTIAVDCTSRRVVRKLAMAPPQITCLSLSSSTAESLSFVDIECCCLVICDTLLCVVHFQEKM